MLFFTKSTAELSGRGAMINRRSCRCNDGRIEMRCTRAASRAGRSRCVHAWVPLHALGLPRCHQPPQIHRPPSCIIHIVGTHQDFITAVTHFIIKCRVIVIIVTIKQKLHIKQNLVLFVMIVRLQ